MKTKLLSLLFLITAMSAWAQPAVLRTAFTTNSTATQGRGLSNYFRAPWIEGAVMENSNVVRNVTNAWTGTSGTHDLFCTGTGFSGFRVGDMIVLHTLNDQYRVAHVYSSSHIATDTTLNNTYAANTNVWDYYPATATMPDINGLETSFIDSGGGFGGEAGSDSINAAGFSWFDNQNHSNNFRATIDSGHCFVIINNSTCCGQDGNGASLRIYPLVPYDSLSISNAGVHVRKNLYVAQNLKVEGVQTNASSITINGGSQNDYIGLEGGSTKWRWSMGDNSGNTFFSDVTDNRNPVVFVPDAPNNALVVNVGGIRVSGATNTGNEFISGNLVVGGNAGVIGTFNGVASNAFQNIPNALTNANAFQPASGPLTNLASTGSNNVTKVDVLNGFLSAPIGTNASLLFSALKSVTGTPSNAFTATLTNGNPGTVQDSNGVVRIYSQWINANSNAGFQITSTGGVIRLASFSVGTGVSNQPIVLASDAGTAQITIGTNGALTSTAAIGNTAGGVNVFFNDIQTTGGSLLQSGAGTLLWANRAGIRSSADGFIEMGNNNNTGYSNVKGSNFQGGTIMITNGITSLVSNVLGLVTVSVGASPFNWTNTFGKNITLLSGGGTVSGLSINGTALPSAFLTGSDSIPLQQNEYVTVTYTVAPTMLWKAF